MGTTEMTGGMSDAMSQKVFISEVFASIQGEGLLTGVPSVFVRVSGCHLRCGFCDTPYTSWDAQGEHRTLASLVDEVRSHTGVKHVVLTGGEPYIVKGAATLAQTLRAEGYHLTVETAGSVWKPALAADLYSVSPKLASSTPDDPTWGPRHDAARIAMDALRAFVATGDYQLKFVAATSADLDEIESLVAALEADPHRVLLMPEGTTVARIDEVAEWLGPECIQRGYRYCDRLHIRLYGNTPGT